MKKLGFGFMRLPTKSDNPGDVDYELVKEMVDYAMDHDFNVFDSAYGYMEGNCDIAIKKCVIDRYPRDDVLISNKMPVYDFDLETNIEEIFTEQLEKCGVEYFDYYLLHCLTRELYKNIVEPLDCFAYIKEQKDKGFIKKIGLSLHDDADTLDLILTEHPEVDVVLLQINYLDWINTGIQSSKCYKVARNHGVEILVMEPLKGGTLVNIPKVAEKKLKEVNPDLSVASWGIRYSASLNDVSYVFSGMSNMEQLKDNVSYMDDFKPLDRIEKRTLRKVRKIIANSIAIDCTYCDYCISHCEENIPISKFFSLYNDAKMALEVQDFYFIYYGNYSKTGAPASACTECGECEKYCTQHLDIRNLLKEITAFFEPQDAS